MLLSSSASLGHFFLYTLTPFHTFFSLDVFDALNIHSASLIGPSDVTASVMINLFPLPHFSFVSPTVPKSFKDL